MTFHPMSIIGRCVMTVFLVCSLSALAHGQITGTVIKVTADLSLTLSGDGPPTDVRLEGITFPERGEPMRAAAREFIMHRAFRKRVEVRVVQRAGLDRVTGAVVLEDGAILNELLVERGYAKAAAEASESYRQLEQSAREQGLGQWEQPTELTPLPHSNDGTSAPSSSSTSALVPVLVGVIVVLLAVILALVWRLGHLSTTPSQPMPEPAVKPVSPQPAGPRQELSAEVVDDFRERVQTLLRNVSAMVQELVAQNATYNDRIEGHKGTIKRATTIAEIREVERIVLGELDELQKTNVVYQQKLDQANETIQQQQQDLDKTRLDAIRDALTRVPNRRAFDERIMEEFSRAQRYAAVFSLILLDVDHFKKTNDTYGHLAGDRVLQAIANLVTQHLRPSDFFARYGGEEFAIILPETPAERAAVVAEKARRAVEAMAMKYQDQTIKVTISAGVAEVRPESDSMSEIIERADQALYRAKDKGRNRIERGRS